MLSHLFPCSNWDCKKDARYTCNSCRLVAYCGQDCQRSDWTRHKTDCEAYLGKETWQPGWVLENRLPAFVAGTGMVPLGSQKDFWGNVPAFDVLQLDSNEGAGYGNPLHLLFAASEDLRNVVRTVAHLPAGYTQPLYITINDQDLDIVARNVIMILIALMVEDPEEAVDCIIHIWYSALIRKSDLDILQNRVRPLIEDICLGMEWNKPTHRVERSLSMRRGKVDIALRKSAWLGLLSYLDAPEGLTADEATRIRRSVTLAETRRDYRDRHSLTQSPIHRRAMNRFREDGLLLPFGSPRVEFRQPNPTFFQSADSWPMKDSADPLQGWPVEEDSGLRSGPATADIYGKLFYYLRTILEAFISRLSTSEIVFSLLQNHVTGLPFLLGRNSFSRIEVSNICDRGYAGIHRTLGVMGPLLQKPDVNPHATLITLFMKAVEEATSPQDEISRTDPESIAMKRLNEYLPTKIERQLGNSSDPETIKFTMALDSLVPCDHIFDRYLKSHDLSEATVFSQAQMKKNHTIIEKWPFRLKLRPGQPGAQEEFDRLLAGDMCGQERYVEWKKVLVDDELAHNRRVKGT